MENKLKTLKCEICNKEITKNSKLSNKQFQDKRYCSVRCRQLGRSKDMKGKQTKENNPNWKGADATNLTTFHKRIEEEFGKPKICAICGTTNEGLTYDWACLTGDYNNIKDYKRLCRSCHKKYDLAMLGKGLITLKDLPLDKRDKKILSLIAVKWIKEDRGLRKDNTIWRINQDELLDLLEDRWMNRFNITEADLEQEK